MDYFIITNSVCQHLIQNKSKILKGIVTYEADGYFNGSFPDAEIRHRAAETVWSKFSDPGKYSMQDRGGGGHGRR